MVWCSKTQVRQGALRVSHRTWAHIMFIVTSHPGASNSSPVIRDQCAQILHDSHVKSRLGGRPFLKKPGVHSDIRSGRKGGCTFMVVPAKGFITTCGTALDTVSVGHMYDKQRVWVLDTAFPLTHYSTDVTTHFAPLGCHIRMAWQSSNLVRRSCQGLCQSGIHSSLAEESLSSVVNWHQMCQESIWTTLRGAVTTNAALSCHKQHQSLRVEGYDHTMTGFTTSAVRHQSIHYV
jgi:hypothetical protein